MRKCRWVAMFLFSAVFLFQVCEFFVYGADPKLMYNTTELILAAGYGTEYHTATTDDGYLLPLFRIMDLRSGKRPKPPVLLMHGLMCASDSWLLQGPKRDLAFLMADSGYDVWLGDLRGDYYSKKHVTMSPEESKFWIFSFHEMGIYDLPAMVDHILAITRQKKLSYIGHSMGTTAFFVMGSERPEMMSKISLFVAMAPAAAWDPKNIPRDKGALLDAGKQVALSFKNQGTYEVLPRTWFAPVLSRMFCSTGSPIQSLCFDWLFFWAGSKIHSISKRTLPRVLSHAPAGLSLFAPLHFLRVMHGPFAPMDYGPHMNMEKYGRIIPEPYNISRVSCPCSMHYSSGDFIVNTTDVKENIKLLPNVVDDINYPSLNHIDYMWGRTAWRTVYRNIISSLDKYNTVPYR